MIESYRVKIIMFLKKLKKIIILVRIQLKCKKKNASSPGEHVG